MVVFDRSRLDTLPLIAGVAVLDLINTVSWRGAAARREDHLRSAADCLAWATRTAVISADEHDQLREELARRPEASPQLLDGLRELRELATVAVLEPGPHSLPPAVQAAFVDARAHGELVAEAPEQRARYDRYRWKISRLDQHTPRRRLAFQLEDLLMAPTGRIGVCADPDCQWVFLDTSRAQNRRWCSSADCGNRYRVQQHQRRQRAASA